MDIVSGILSCNRIKRTPVYISPLFGENLAKPVGRSSCTIKNSSQHFAAKGNFKGSALKDSTGIFKRKSRSALKNLKNYLVALHLHNSAKTPCAVSGDRCYDCKSPGRICRGMVTLMAPMSGMEAEVLLIDEDLGL